VWILKPPAFVFAMQQQDNADGGEKGYAPSIAGFGKRKGPDEEVRMLLKMIIKSQDELKDKIHGTH
jgi:hypothetical protein